MFQLNNEDAYPIFVINFICSLSLLVKKIHGIVLILINLGK